MNTRQTGLIKTPNNVWSFGGTLSETVLDFGSRRYQVQQARAAYDETVAMYRSITIHSVQIASNKLWLSDRQ
ncbi:MAG: transporter [Gammaproteobacteria bacterium]|nr:transporter [Gammaproteobacteria bacterium]